MGKELQVGRTESSINIEPIGLKTENPVFSLRLLTECARRQECCSKNQVKFPGSNLELKIIADH
jgi:hypothetical protein